MISVERVVQIYTVTLMNFYSITSKTTSVTNEELYKVLFSKTSSYFKLLI